jgi:hypothetical protein
MEMSPDTLKKIEKLRGYGVAMSDAEGGWSPAFKAKIKKDDLAYPEYFKNLGIKYIRTGTLAKGNKCCDFRFERIIKQENK